MIRSIRLLVFASVLTMAHGVLAEERIGIRSHSLGWLRGLDNAHVLVLKITESRQDLWNDEEYCREGIRVWYPCQSPPRPTRKATRSITSSFSLLSG